MRPAPKRLTLVATVLLVLALSGVGEGATENASPKRWASVFCGSVVVWEQTVLTSTTELDKTLQKYKASGTPSLPKVRAALVLFLGHIVEATNGLTDTVHALGPPDIKSGARLQRGVLAAFGKLARAFENAEAAARKLPVSSPQAFSHGADALAHEIKTSGNEVGGAFKALGSYSSPALDNAANNDPSCKALARLGSSPSEPASGKIIAKTSSSGDFAVALATGEAKKPGTISVSVESSPRQEVDVYWTMVCVRGFGAGSKSGSFSEQTPRSRKLAFPMSSPDDCTVSANAQLSNSGNITVKLLSS